MPSQTHTLTPPATPGADTNGNGYSDLEDWVREYFPQTVTVNVAI
jgi:hypothetical protein